MPPSALPIARPRFLIDGMHHAALSDRLLRLRVREDWQGLAGLSATFGNWGDRQGVADYLYADRQLLDFGKSVEVLFDDAPVFVGVIMALGGEYPAGQPPTVTVLAEDRLQDLRMTRRTRSFADASDADVITQIAREQGLTADVDVVGATFPLLAQINQSDLAFLRERGREAGFEVWVTDRTLHAAPRPGRAGNELVLGLGRELTEFRVCADLAGQHTELQVTGWDVAGKTAIAEQADASVLAGGELGDDESGAAVLQAARGQRIGRWVHALPSDAGAARVQARARFQAGARRFVTGAGCAVADARLRVGRGLRLAGLGPMFDGRYTLVEVTHRFDGERGLRSEFLVERPGVGRRP